MTAFWVVGGIVAWLTVAVAIGRIWRWQNPRDIEGALIFSLFWPIMLPLTIIFSPVLVAWWLITQPTKAERLKAKRETEDREARWRAHDIAILERELGIKDEPLP